jgi:hypothetical protein
MRLVPALPRWLGLAGLLPQLAFAACAWIGDAAWLDPARIGGGMYAGLILSFLGGAWWGLAAAAPAAEGRGVLRWVWVAAVTPSLVALGAGLWWLARPEQPEPALVTLAFALMASPLVDSRLAAMGLAPRWWTALRWPLSSILGLATLALAVR